MDGLNKRICRVLIVKLILLKIMFICLKACKCCKQYLQVVYNILIENNRADSNRVGSSRQKRGESSLSKIYSNMVKHAVKCKKKYVYCPRD